MDDTANGKGGDGETDYTWAAIAAQIGPQCIGCHADGGTAVPQLGEDPGNLINQKSNYYSGKTLVVPGDPESSFLFQKLRGTQGDGTLRVTAPCRQVGVGLALTTPPPAPASHLTVAPPPHTVSGA